MVACPIGILMSNIIFGRFLDTEILSQNSLDGNCYGSICYSKSYTIFSGIQVVSILASVGVYIIRMRERTLHTIPVSDVKNNSKKSVGGVSYERIQMSAVDDDDLEVA